jgi:hypothetical protein
MINKAYRKTNVNRLVLIAGVKLHWFKAQTHGEV